MSAFLRPVAMLTAREAIRFVRQPSRIVGALGTPLIFWIFLGSGLGRSFQSPGMSQGVGGYLEYFFPGSLALVLLFSSIFTNISIIEDRREGFLQSVLVAPISRVAIVVGKILGGTLLASVQGGLFLLLAPLLGIAVTPVSLLFLVVAIVLTSFCLTALGFGFAWRLNSVQGFHSIMNTVLMPMWLLSGALFPAQGAPMWLRVLMYANPLTYGLKLVKLGLSSGDPFATNEWVLPFALVSVLSVLFVTVGTAAVLSRGTELKAS